MIRLTCAVSGESIWIQPVMILCIQRLWATAKRPAMTRVDLDSDQEFVLVLEMPDAIAMTMF